MRADATSEIGAGHVMRLTSIAEELIMRGATVIFVGQFAELPWLSERIHGLGFSKIHVNPIEFSSNPNTDVLILDSYTLPIDNEFIHPNNWRKVVTISDESTPMYAADLVISPGISENWAPKQGVKILAGPKYIPLRKSITQLKSFPKDERCVEILVVGGGTDPFHFVEAVANKLISVQAPFHATLFSNNLSSLKLDSRFTCVSIGPKLDTYANLAEVIFTTASTTSFEFIAREIAVGVGCAVENQNQYYESLSQAGIAAPIGKTRQGNWELEDHVISELICSREFREKLVKTSRGVVDFYGAIRIVEEIQKL